MVSHRTLVTSCHPQLRHASPLDYMMGLADKQRAQTMLCEQLADIQATLKLVSTFELVSFSSLRASIELLQANDKSQHPRI